MPCNSSSLPSSCFSRPACNSGSCFSMPPNREVQAILYYMNLSFKIIYIITHQVRLPLSSAASLSAFLCPLPGPFPPFPHENQSSSLALDQSVVSSLSPAQDPRESGGGAMFQGQRGWFCRSVSQDLRQFWGRKVGGAGCGSQSILLWKPPARGRLPYPVLTCALASTVDEGGMVSDAQAADFLFSCDASHPDTLRYPRATVEPYLSSCAQSPEWKSSFQHWGTASLQP